MADEGATMEVVEGQARLRLPLAERQERGPGKRIRQGAAAAASTGGDSSTAGGNTPTRGFPPGPPLPQVFYNPAMALNRDVASLVFATQAKEGWQVLDGLAASGVRGLRYALESGKAVKVLWNDWNPLAARLLRENAELNGLEPNVVQRSLGALLHEFVWHCVEIDPFGSPAPFLDAATRAVRGHGLLGLTATDATGLAGVYPEVCERRYLATPLHGELGHEVALRILAGAAVRQGAKHECAYAPLYSHATDHYYRVMLRCVRGARRVDLALESIGHLALCRACGHREFSDARACARCGEMNELAGPLWTGPLADVDTARAVVDRLPAHPLARRDETERLARTVLAEAEAPFVPYDLHEVGRRLGIGSAPREPVFEKLRAQGFRVARVHYNPLFMRTDAPLDVVEAAVREATAEALQ